MNTTVSTADRNAMSLTLSVLMIAAVVLGISFSYDENPEQTLHSMDVILAHKSNLENNEDAEYLSKSNQLGGGEQKEKTRPQHVTAALSADNPGNAPVETRKQMAQREENQLTQVVDTRSSEVRVQNVEDPVKNKQSVKAPDAAHQEDLKMAKLEDEIANKINQYAKRPKTKYISASTKAYEFAPYVDNWVKKIERTGDLNYPQRAKRKDFKGNVMLTVAINKNGTLHDIRVVRTSGHQFLDEAAVHIVELATPFEPLPETNENIDILYITRTWQFLPGHLLRHK